MNYYVAMDELIIDKTNLINKIKKIIKPECGIFTYNKDKKIINTFQKEDSLFSILNNDCKNKTRNINFLQNILDMCLVIKNNNEFKLNEIELILDSVINNFNIKINENGTDKYNLEFEINMKDSNNITTMYNLVDTIYNYNNIADDFTRIIELKKSERNFNRFQTFYAGLKIVCVIFIGGICIYSYKKMISYEERIEKELKEIEKLENTNKLPKPEKNDNISKKNNILKDVDWNESSRNINIERNTDTSKNNITDSMKPPEIKMKDENFISSQ